MVQRGKIISMSSLEDVLAFLNDCESRFPVADWEINGIHIWPLIRIEARIHIIRTQVLKGGGEAYLKRSPRSVIVNFASRAIRNYFQIKQDPEMDDSFTKRDVLFFTGGIGYTDYFGRSLERFFDPFKMYFDKEDISMLRLDFSETYEARRFSPSIYIRKELNKFLALKIILLKKSNGYREQLEQFEDFVTHAKRRGVVIASLEKKFLRMRVRKIVTVKAYFRQKLLVVNPHLVLITNYYNDFSFALIHECRNRGIKTIDVQHGVQGKLHSAYGGWNNVPKHGYNILPDYFWCWSEADAEEINRWSRKIDRHKAIPGGNLFLELLKDRSSEIYQKYQAYFDKRRANNEIIKEERLDILVSLQTDMVGDEILGSLYGAMKETDSLYNWWVRLHPAMANRKNDIIALFEHKGISNLEIELATETSLYVLLQNIDVHITHSSSVVLEAASFAVPSIVVSQYGADLYTQEINKGNCLFLDNTNAIIEKLKELTIVRYRRGEVVQPSAFRYNNYLGELRSLVKKQQN